MPDDGFNIGPLDQQVMLAILQLRPRAYGVSIQDLIHGATDREYTLGAIYASLGRLEDKGYTTSKLGESTPERGGRAKIYFDLTPPGLQALRQSLEVIDCLRRPIRVKEALA